ncbi:MAG: GNAT family N-acetyltransferase [Rhodoblastus sp.]|nr:GNAT family N-acetyltransferase [Rhodoblastus sp.]MCB9999429.1 GNAT family N-acetyltransferase [Methylobacteriaceae bacterium]MCC0001795.1 GNAT family N-acetyltransferase [Methylobacteriaceae bacterium]HPG02023.1 GNAT family N-acetyltransferase [Rhodoblastus sp.]
MSAQAASATAGSNPSRLEDAPAALARVETFERPWPALRAWREIEAFATGSAYQTLGFVLPWYEHLAQNSGATPLVIVGYDARERPAIVLPLAVKRRGPARLAMFAGGKHSNLNLPLMRPGFSLAPDGARGLLLSAARASAEAIDCFLLLNQPCEWAGAENPFATIGGHPSPSFAFGATIGADAEAFLKRIDSASTRKKLRAKERKLAELGPLTYERATDTDRAHTILQAFVDQKTLRFSQKNRDPGFAQVAVRAFLDAMSSGRGSGAIALEFHALSVGDRIVATYGGLPRGRTWHGMINSFNVDPQIARSSPAELLLRHIIRDLGSRGFERFDLGIGESRYKNAICDEEIALADLVLPATALGAAWAPVERSRLAAKRWVKKTPWALAFVEQMRAGPA